MTREKVIEGLEKALAISKEVDSGYIWITVGEGKKALELLKEREQNCWTLTKSSQGSSIGWSVKT